MATWPPPRRASSGRLRWTAESPVPGTTMARCCSSWGGTRPRNPRCGAPLELEPRFSAACYVLGKLLRAEARVRRGRGGVRGGCTVSTRAISAWNRCSCTRSTHPPGYRKKSCSSAIARSGRNWNRRSYRAMAAAPARGSQGGACASATYRATSIGIRWRFSRSRCWSGTTVARSRSYCYYTGVRIGRHDHPPASGRGRLARRGRLAGRRIWPT